MGPSPETSLPQKLLSLQGKWAESRPLADHACPSNATPLLPALNLCHPVTRGLKGFHTKQAAWSNPTQHLGSENGPQAGIPSYEPGERRVG